MNDEPRDRMGQLVVAALLVAEADREAERLGLPPGPFTESLMPAIERQVGIDEAAFALHVLADVIGRDFAPRFIAEAAAALASATDPARHGPLQ